jgi:RND family efflux transporter MFP subunit
VPQEHALGVADGVSVTVQLDVLPDRPLEGKVAAKVPVKDPSARTFLVRVEVDDAAKFMTPGMSARVIFELRGPRAAVSVPRDALVRSPDGTNSVWVVNENGGVATVSERRVEVGRTLADSVEVRGGLEAGTLVVLRGNEILKEGQQVSILDRVD